MLSGFSARYHILHDGKRQLTALHLTGDFLDLHSLLLKVMDHGVTALTDCQIARVPHDRLRMSFATLTVDRFDEAARRLAAACRAPMNTISQVVTTLAS